MLLVAFLARKTTCFLTQTSGCKQKEALSLPTFEESIPESHKNVKELWDFGAKPKR
jgi:hypothetical protein